MLNLVKAEYLKLLTSKKIWITLAILLFFPLYQAINSKVTVNHGGELVQVVDTVVNGATGILMIEKNALTVLLVISAFISFFIGQEFQHGTIRNALALGRSRAHFYLSKLSVASIFTLIGVFIMTMLGMVAFTIAFGFGEVEGINNYLTYATSAFLTLYLLILSNVSVYVMVSFLTKSSSIALVWSFVYTMITGFGPTIFQETENFQYVTYWFTESFLFYTNMACQPDIERFPEMAIVSLITIVLSSVIGIYFFKRTDIK